MRHARFYRVHPVNSDKLVQALGSDSIVYLDDANLTPSGCHKIVVERAVELNRKNGLNKRYVGYAIFNGRSLVSSTPTTTTIFPTSVEYIEICRGQKATI